MLRGGIRSTVGPLSKQDVQAMSSSWNVKVGDAAHAAKSADALVAEASAEREGRRADRLRIRAIVRIQSALRAHRERSNVMNKVRATLRLLVCARALHSDN